MSPEHSQAPTLDKICVCACRYLFIDLFIVLENPRDWNFFFSVDLIIVDQVIKNLFILNNPLVKCEYSSF